MNKVAVKREFTGQGFSKELIDFSKKLAIDYGINTIRLNCNQHRNKLSEVYEKERFICTEERTFLRIMILLYMSTIMWMGGLMTKLKVIFFDMGNTLLHFHYGKPDEEKDFRGLIYLTEYLKKFNENITFDEVKNDFFECWMEGIKDRNSTFREYPIEGFLNSFLMKFNVKLTVSECIEAVNLFYTEYREQIFFEDSLYNTLKTIKDKGYRIGVISNTCYYDEVMKECFKKAGIYNLIDNFTFSYSLRVGKPNTKIFIAALETMKVIPAESIMVGDNLKSDIKPALDLGMKTIWINNKNKKLDGNIIPNIEISCISELLNNIDKVG